MALVAEQSEAREDGLLDVGDLCRMFEESEDSSWQSRKDSERDRDYLDGKQLTAAEIKELEGRGQPPVVDNRIKTKIDYLVGLEKTQRVKPKAFPRTPKHEADADSATEALRYVAEEQSYESKRSGVWRNMLVEGIGGIRVYAQPSKYGQPVDYMATSAIVQPEMDVCLQRIAWDRLFFDPHSAEADFSDAGYLGIVTWMDYDDALAMYPNGQGILDVTLQSAPSDTYDDKPKSSHWADKKRKRVRICQIWIKRADDWYFAEFTKGGILKGGPSPYVTDKGESDCELIFQSAYVDRDNNRYGLVREMVSLQDEINKRRSKMLDLLVRNQVTYEEGAVENIDEYRRQRAKTDGTMKVNPGTLSNPHGPKIVSEQKLEVAAAHFELLQESKNSIDLKGPNATEMGDKTQGSSAASGRAILASQQGGMIQIGDLMDNLRHLDKRVYRAAWARIRQFWTGPKWIRVTDDERSVRWLGLNIPPQEMAQFQMQQQMDPESYRSRVAGVSGPIAELDCDIIIDDAPDSMTLAIEQFETLTQLKQFDKDGEIPFRSIVRAIPNLKDKQMFLKEMDEQAQRKQQAQAPMQELQVRGAVAEVAETESKANLNNAKAAEAGRPDMPGQPEQQEPFTAEKTLAEIRKLMAGADKDSAAAEKTRVEAMLAPAEAAHQRDMDRANFAQGVRASDEDRKIAARAAARKTVAA